MTRHQRRKAAKVRQQDKLERLALAERANRVAQTVRKNMSQPIDRNFYAGTISSVYRGNFAPRANGFGIKH